MTQKLRLASLSAVHYGGFGEQVFRVINVGRNAVRISRHPGLQQQREQNSVRLSVVL